MTAVRTIALAILASVILGWAVLGWSVWRAFHGSQGGLLTDTYYVVFEAKWIAQSLALSLIPPLIAVGLALRKGRSTPLLRAAIYALLVGAGLLLISSCINLAIYLIPHKGMPRRFEFDPLIQIGLVASYVRTSGILVVATGLIFAGIAGLGSWLRRSPTT